MAEQQNVQRDLGKALLLSRALCLLAHAGSGRFKEQLPALVSAGKQWVFISPFQQIKKAIRY